MDVEGNLFVLAADYAENPRRDITVFTHEGKLLTRFALPEPASHIWISPLGHLFAIGIQSASVTRYEFPERER